MRGSPAADRSLASRRGRGADQDQFLGLIARRQHRVDHEQVIRTKLSKGAIAALNGNRNE